MKLTVLYIHAYCSLALCTYSNYYICHVQAGNNDTLTRRSRGNDLFRVEPEGGYVT